MEGLAVIVGLRAEARLAHRLGVPVFAGGGTASGAQAATARAIAAGARILLSFGLAGGLDAALRPGAIIIPSAVLTRGATLHADPTLLAWLGGATPRPLLGADSLAASAAEKRSLWQHTRAAALDLESGAVARAAAAHGLPFAALRAVCDPAGRDLPPAALAALNARGVIGLGRVLASLTRHPAQLPTLLTLAADAARARRALAQHIATISSR